MGARHLYPLMISQWHALLKENGIRFAREGTRHVTG